MAYKPQYGPGTSKVAEVRRNQMNPNVKLEKIRSVTDEDIVLIMGHRAPGQAYPSAHPPLAEQGEPDCPIRKIVKPTEGAKAGDRVRYIQFADSMLNAPCQPYQRTYLEMYRYRGIDPGTLSGRQIVECRVRILQGHARGTRRSDGRREFPGRYRGNGSIRDRFSGKAGTVRSA